METVTRVVKVKEKKGKRHLTRFISIPHAPTEEEARVAYDYLAAFQRRVAEITRAVAAVTAGRFKLITCPEYSNRELEYYVHLAAPMSRGRRASRF